MNERPEDIRKQVSESYARAIKGASSCCGSGVPAGAAAKIGYRAEDLAGVPGQVVESSFGCGNPVAFSEIGPGEVVLDLGSGAGLDLILAAKKVGPTGKVIGIDMTDAMIEKARANIAASGMTNIEVRRGLIESMPVESGTVDWVISNCVINLSPEKDRVFAEIARVLKPGGRMLVSDIVVQDLPAWVRSSAELWSSCVAGAISEEDYVGGLKKAGLDPVEVRERLVYEKSQLVELVRSELPEKITSGGGCCGAAAIVEPALEGIASQVAGKIWSARFYAKKPG